VNRWPPTAALPGGIDSEAVWEVFDGAAAAAARHTLAHFRTPIVVENKSAHGFDPVTEADRAAERAIREVIAARFAEHAIVGEELADRPGSGPYVWQIDPIDGTRAYISGLPLWGTLIGLTCEGRAIAGQMSQPFLGETYVALAGAARAVRNGESAALTTSGVRSLAAARLAPTTPRLFASAGSRAAYGAVEAACSVARYGTDCYGYCMLAAGHVDLVIEEGLRPLDIVALIPIIEAAGGVISDWKGGPAEGGGQILAAASPDLHAEALALLAPAAA
jgi:histidinol phosphatase-like enzyme (inositol monophosphatase family)